MQKKDIINKLLNLSDDTNKAIKHAINNNLPFSYLTDEAKQKTAELLQGFQFYKNLDDDQETYAADEARPRARNSGGRVCKYIKHGRQFFEVYGIGILQHYGRGDFVKL
jgi:hypothetical protein